MCSGPLTLASWAGRCRASSLRIRADRISTRAMSTRTRHSSLRATMTAISSCFGIRPCQVRSPTRMVVTPGQSYLRKAFCFESICQGVSGQNVILTSCAALLLLFAVMSSRLASLRMRSSSSRRVDVSVSRDHSNATISAFVENE